MQVESAVAKDKDSILSPEDREQIRRQLQELDSNANADKNEPSRQRMYGLAVMVIAIFFLGLCNFLPAGSNRVLILTMSMITLGVGAWQFDKARR